jgi:hypothetical protein
LNIRNWGAGMFNHPHGLHVDHNGNVCATDDHGGGKGHQVFKLSPQGKVLMTLGKPGIAGAKGVERYARRIENPQSRP